MQRQTTSSIINKMSSEHMIPIRCRTAHASFKVDIRISNKIYLNLSSIQEYCTNELHIKLVLLLKKNIKNV